MNFEEGYRLLFTSIHTRGSSGGQKLVSYFFIVYRTDKSLDGIPIGLIPYSFCEIEAVFIK